MIFIWFGRPEANFFLQIWVRLFSHSNACVLSLWLFQTTSINGRVLGPYTKRIDL